MSVVVSLGAYRKKGTMTAIRELLVLASKGQIAGLRFDVELVSGGHRHGETGKFAGPQIARDAPELIPLVVRQSKPSGIHHP